MVKVSIPPNPCAHGRNPGIRRTPGQTSRCTSCWTSSACCVFRRGAWNRSERPQNGSASTGKLNYSSVCCGNRSMRALHK